MSHDSGQAGRSGGAVLLRAGRALGSALLTRSGARWVRSRPRRLGRFGLAALLFASGAAAAYAAGQTTAVPTGDRAAIEAVVRDYILEHPEIITQAMQKLESQRVARLVEENRLALETPYAGAWDGAAKGDVTLVAFMDYACGYCRASLPDIARLLQEDKGLRIVYHELPIISQESLPAARVSLYAAEKGKFAAFHHAMYAQGGVDRDKILKAAATAGLDAAQTKAELDDERRNPVIAGNIRLAQAVEASGTPLFVVGDQVMYGAVGYDALKAAIAKARGKAQAPGS